AEATHGLLRQARSERVEIAGREALTLEGARPLARQLLYESIALGGQAPRALDQLRQLGGHGLLPHVATHGVHEIRLPARGGDAFETRLHPELAGLAEAKGAHLAVDRNVGGRDPGPPE